MSQSLPRRNSSIAGNTETLATKLSVDNKPEIRVCKNGEVSFIGCGKTVLEVGQLTSRNQAPSNYTSLISAVQQTTDGFSLHRGCNRDPGGGHKLTMNHFNDGCLLDSRFLGLVTIFGPVDICLKIWYGLVFGY